MKGKQKLTVNVRRGLSWFLHHGESILEDEEATAHLSSAQKQRVEAAFQWLKENSEPLSGGGPK